MLICIDLLDHTAQFCSHIRPGALDKWPFKLRSALRVKCIVDFKDSMKNSKMPL